MFWFAFGSVECVCVAVCVSEFVCCCCCRRETCDVVCRPLGQARGARELWEEIVGRCRRMKFGLMVI